MIFSPRLTLGKFLAPLGVFLLGLAVFAAAVPRAAFALTDVSGAVIAEDAVWNSAGSPYVVRDGESVEVDAGATLTVLAGTVVKFGEDSSLDVFGKLSAEGSPEQKIYFTSLKDDSVAGDTNGDGAATVPSDFDDWGVTFYEDSGPHLVRHSSLTFSEDGFYSLNRAPVSYEDIFVATSSYGVYAKKSSITLSRARFSNIVNEAFLGYGGNYVLNDIHVSDVLFSDAVGFYDGATASLSNVDIRNTYSGSAIWIEGSTVSVADSTLFGGLVEGIIAVKQFWPPEKPSVLSVTRSVIRGFSGSGIFLIGSRATVSKTAIRNSDTGVYSTESKSFSTGAVTASDVALSESAIFDNASYGLRQSGAGSADARGNFWGDASGPYNEERNPSGRGNAVIGNVDFSGWLSEDPTVAVKKIDPVIIIPGLLGSAEKNGVWQIDPIFHVYDDLIDTLRANGYTDGKDLFSFPYDWRKSNVDTAFLLRDKIAAVKQVCACGKVDLVAHSMGGLAARQYIQSADYAGDVDQLIFLGTPHLGAPKAYLTWEAGESAKSGQDQFIKALLSREAKKAGYPSFLAYIQTKPLPAFRELLSTANYIRDIGSTTPRVYPENYPRNIFLENLNNNVSTLLNSGVKISNIVGNTGASTVSTLRVLPSHILPLWRHGYPEDFYVATSTDNGLELGIGDGTVPLPSAEFINSDLTTMDSSHIFLPKNSEGLIYKKLTNKEATKLIDKLHIINIKLLLIQILSPADIIVVAPDGKRVGKDFATGNEVNEIDGAFYSGFGADDEYVTIPNPEDGEYKVITQGTGSGEYTVATALISDDGSAEASFSGETLPNLITPIAVNVSNEENVIETKSLDVTSPVLSILSPQNKDYVRGEKILISASSTDSESLVISSELTLNGMAVENGSFFDTAGQKLGDYKLAFSATDSVGNSASSTVNFRVIVTAQTIIDDVERLLALGSITNKGIKDALLAKLRQILRLEKILKRSEQKFRDRFDKITIQGRWLLADLEKHHLKFINDEAYNLLVEEIRWLMYK